MIWQTYRVVLTPANGESVRSIHYVEAHTHSEARTSALLQQLQLDMEDGAFKRWAAIMVKPLGDAVT